MNLEIPRPEGKEIEEDSVLRRITSYEVNPVALAITDHQKALVAFVRTKLGQKMTRVEIEHLCLSEELVNDPDASELDAAGSVVRHIAGRMGWKTIAAAQLAEVFESLEKAAV